ncbi:HEAT repeat domain-containing protein [Rapidithrix thailandica]|uniref:HEAT repeat domain-containing protein n=1 Tax=Rapidithrix thailandica TaxID=413964 RepID=A0AAW9SKY1_9BACT
MSTTEYLDDLLERLENENLRPGLSLPEGVSFQSDLTIAWEARKEVQMLKDPQFIEPLKVRLEKEKVTKKRVHIIQVLVRIADKAGEHSTADYILDLVRNEKVRWIRDVALTALNHSTLKISKEKEYLFELAKHKDWQIKLNTLGLLYRLGQSYSPRIEEVCLELVKVCKKKPHELSSICHVLSKHGSLKSIESLKDIASTNSKAFTVNAAIRALEEINGANELEFFKALFETNRNNDVKSVITQALCKYGDGSVPDLLIKRVKSILSKPRKTSTVYIGEAQPELVHIFTFLMGQQDTRADTIFDFVRKKKLDLLDTTERKWFDENLMK